MHSSLGFSFTNIMGSINTQKTVSATVRVGNECLRHAPLFAEVCLAVALAKVSTSACETQLLFIGHSLLPPDAGYRSNKEVGTIPLFTIYFHYFSPAAADGDVHLRCEVTICFSHSEILLLSHSATELFLTQEHGCWILRSSKTIHIMLAGLGGCLGFYFRVGEVFLLKKGT